MTEQPQAFEARALDTRRRGADRRPAAAEQEVREHAVAVEALADTVEAVFGAIFLDSGYVAARMSVVKAFEPLLARLDAHMPKDAKTRLQEYLQSRNLALPRYAVLNIEGEDHAQTFQVSCEVPDLGRRVLGRGLSRRRAEQEAAERMLTEIETHPAPERPA